MARSAALHRAVETIEDENAATIGLVSKPAFGVFVFGKVPVAVDMRGNQQGNRNLLSIKDREEPASLLPRVIKDAGDRYQKVAIHKKNYRTGIQDSRVGPLSGFYFSRPVALLIVHAYSKAFWRHFS